jgi:ATP-dependent Clp protease ATP-binding subunit ClpA
MGHVVDKFVREVEAELRGRKVKLTLSPEARTWLAEKGYDPQFGARPMARVIQVELKDKLAEEMLFGRLTKGGHVRVVRQGDGLGFELDG